MLSVVVEDELPEVRDVYLMELQDRIDHSVMKTNATFVQAAVKNGYTTTHPKFTECTRLVTDNGSLSIMNEGLDRIREELYQYQHNNNNKKKHKSTGNGTQN